MVVLGLDYQTSSALLHCACDARTVEVVAAIFCGCDGGGGGDGGDCGGDGGDDNDDSVEVFGNGQLVYKEARGGHLVNVQQDAAFFQLDGHGPVGTLDTSAPPAQRLLYRRGAAAE